ncbi:hypothetical protein [Acidiphilium acidophilum]|uniref:Uncharacterized protein n=1 Tax=Acidiphilium acidophilum TaxID=76588 RepID=A0AAW9DMQ4_ACIAO|nr:hypothetical protein [Acidiphilium acidophilum]MDX5929617.1 hypothetical protein [Acidiphilium acidophilum]
MQKNSLRWTYVFSIFFLILLSLFYFHIFLFYPKDSDDANALLIGQNLFSGNWYLSGWWIAPDNFITSDEIVYGALLKIFGFRPAILAAVPAILWALLLLLSGWLALNRRGYTSAWRLLPVAIILGFPMLPSNAVLGAITQSPAHVGTMCYVVAIFLVADRLVECTTIRWWYVIFLVVLTGLATSGDPLADFVGTAPVIVGVLITSQGSRQVRLSIFLSVCLGSLIGYEAIRINMAFGGFSAGAIPMVFANASEFTKNFSLTIQSILMIFGADFLGMPLKDALPTLLRFFIVLYVAYVVLFLLHKSMKKLIGDDNKEYSIDFVDIILSSGIILNILSALFSTSLIDIHSGRYFSIYSPPIMLTA